jgi:hypothetical protein
MNNWRRPNWDRDDLNIVARVAIPTSGGFVYRIRDDGFSSYVWAPDLQVWVDAIAKATSSQTRVVAVMSNFAAATHKKQPVPRAGA